MVAIKEVDLRTLGIRFPSHLVGMVAAQPYLKITEEPFICELDYKAQQMAIIERTLEIAKSADHEAEKTHFTLFPEYSIPGLAGINRITEIMADSSWPSGTVIIGGSDALSKEQYRQLCQEPQTVIDVEYHQPNDIPDDEWINCCIIWVKGADNNVTRWLQPKLAPAWPEQNIHHRVMFRGKSVFVFQATFDNDVPCHFLSLVCFDWIAKMQGQSIVKHLLSKLNALGTLMPLSWVFVPQYNERPSHAAFLTEAATFFQNPAEAPLVQRQHCSIVFTNSAGTPAPGRAELYGRSSVVYSPNCGLTFSASHPTYYGNPRSLQDRGNLSPCGDVLFRENGACIHSFSQYVCAFVNSGVSGKTLPFEHAKVHAVEAGSLDPRTPGTAVPSGVKWLNDFLDTVSCLSSELPQAALTPAIKTSHSENIACLRKTDSTRLKRDINYATADSTAKPGGPTKDADQWGRTEEAAIENVIQTCDIFATSGAALNFETTEGHSRASLNGHATDLLAIRGLNYEECLEHIKRVYPAFSRTRILFVLRDKSSTRMTKRERNFLRPAQTEQFANELLITEPSSREMYLGFGDLLEMYKGSESTTRLGELIYDRLAV